MTTWRDNIKPIIEVLEEGRVRIVLEAYTHEIGVLYFEKAKKGWTNKPLTNGWTCIDAKVEGLYIHGGDGVTPKELVAWCQVLLNDLPTGGV